MDLSESAPHTVHRRLFMSETAPIRSNDQEAAK
jgi:hypothetical protein